MKVIITGTPEVSTEQINQIVEILNVIIGPIIFESGSILVADQLQLVTDTFSVNTEEDLIPFSEFFKVCNAYRLIRMISTEDFVVVISEFNNEKEWLSGFSEKNIFVYCNIWERLTPNKPNFAIAHQIIENVFQSLIKLNISDVANEPNIHKGLTGCLNDYCENEEEVLTKLKMAEICHSCQQRAQNHEVDRTILLQVKEVLESLRKHFLEFQPIEIQQEPIKVDERGEIVVGNKTLKLDPLHRTLLIYFLIYRNEKIAPCDLEKRKVLLINLYSIFKEMGDNSPIDYLINDLTSFSDKKSKLKKSLIEQLGNAAKYYWIERFRVYENGIQNHYHQISLSEDLIHISPEFIKKIGL